MSIRFQCPHCSSKMKLADSAAGRRVRCPDCDEMVDVPEAQDGVSEAAETGSSDETAAVSPAAEEAGRAAAASAGGRWTSPPSGELGQEATDGGDHDGGDDDGGRYDGDEYDEEYDDEYDDDEEVSSGLGEKKPMAEGEMDMTPMVDVTFLLLIFFMVTAAFSLQKSIQIPKPEQTDEPSTAVVEEPEESPDVVTVQIDEYNTFTVLTADWEKEAAGEIDLIARLRDARLGNDAGVVPSALLVKAHGKALHYRVVMALDAGSETGFEDVQLMTVDGDF